MIIFHESIQSKEGATGEEVYLMFACINTGETVYDAFTRVVDIDTEQVLFSFYPTVVWSGIVAYCPPFIMPDGDFRLRIECGRGDNIDDTYDLTIPHVVFPSNRNDIHIDIDNFYATEKVFPGELIYEIVSGTTNRKTNYGYGKQELWNMDEKILWSEYEFSYPGNGRSSLTKIWWNFFKMPNHDLHLQLRTYHHNPTTGEYLPDPDAMEYFTIKVKEEETEKKFPYWVLLLAIPLAIPLMKKFKSSHLIRVD